MGKESTLHDSSCQEIPPKDNLYLQIHFLFLWKPEGVCIGSLYYLQHHENQIHTGL